jgi:uncharacterized protein YkwD
MIDLQELIDAHNKQREAHRLDPFQKDDDLMDIAQKWAENMANGNGLVHQRLQFGPDWNAEGENIAEGQNSVDDVINTWMHSLGHRRNILNRSFSYIGVGYAESPNGTPYWCVDFGGKS